MVAVVVKDELNLIQHDLTLFKVQPHFRSFKTVNLLYVSSPELCENTIAKAILEKQFVLNKNF